MDISRQNQQTVAVTGQKRHKSKAIRSGHVLFLPLTGLFLLGSSSLMTLQILISQISSLLVACSKKRTVPAVTAAKTEPERKKSHKAYKDRFHSMWLITERLNTSRKNKIVAYSDLGDILLCSNERKGSSKCSNPMLHPTIKGDSST